MVSAYICYNIVTDFIVLKFLLFMVVTSYYWISDTFKIFKINSVNVSVIECCIFYLKFPK